MRLVADTDYQQLMDEGIQNEARVLPPRVNNLGERIRPLGDAIRLMEQVQVAGWASKLGGPRTSLWFLRQLSLKSTSLKDWHTLVQKAAGAKDDDWGMPEHKRHLGWIEDIILFGALGWTFRAWWSRRR